MAVAVVTMSMMVMMAVTVRVIMIVVIMVMIVVVRVSGVIVSHGPTSHLEPVRFKWIHLKRINRLYL